MKRGALMSAATWLAALSLTAGVVTLAACSQSGPDAESSTTASTSPTTSPSSTSTASSGEVTFTVDELAGFDGKDGRAAYVAVDGVVYDLTGSRSWPDGNHSLCNLGAMAGKDLSEEMKKAPSNMWALLALMPMVGKMAK